MRKVFLILCSLTLMLHGDEELLEVASQKCDFDGKKLILSGSVTLDHELGCMTAAEAILYPDPEGKKNSIGFLEIKKKVSFTSKDGAELTCGTAKFNYKTLRGHFEGDDTTDFVTYRENAKGKDKPSLMVRSRSMEAQIEQADTNANSRSTLLAEIVAIKDVEVEYDSNFRITADRGIYHRKGHPEEGKSSKGLFGIVILSMDMPEEVCHFRRDGGDFIDSPNVRIDTIKRSIHFKQPRGVVKMDLLTFSAATDKSNKPIDQKHNQSRSGLAFSSDNLLWEINRDFLRLSKNVFLEISDSGTLTTDEDLDIYYHLVKGKRQLRTLESHGESVLTRPEKLTGYEHQLYCFNTLIVDHEKLKTTIDSPMNERGLVPKGKQAIFRDSLGEIHADKLVILYQMIDGKITPINMVAEGQVFMLDRKGAPTNEEAALLRYALADRVEYTFARKEAIFAAKNRNRVLLFDKVNNLQVSAPGLIVKRDGTSNKETIQGIGDVRFSFREKECEQFKDRFKSLPNRY